MYIMQTRLHNQEINSKKLYEFTNTAFCRKQMKGNFMSDIFYTSSHSHCKLYACVVISYFHTPDLSSCLNLIITKFEFTMGSPSYLTLYLNTNIFKGDLCNSTTFEKI